MTAVQICNGLGAGNIGDELMARAFWDALPVEVSLLVEVFPNAERQREPLPSRLQYRHLDWNGQPPIAAPDAPGLLIGDTPVTETLGLDWPLRFLAPRLEAFHRVGQPVHALGVGVEPLRSDEARALFRRHFLPIRSWTVRTPACRQTLLELGVAEHRLALGADWAWLYRPGRALEAWGSATWTELGIEPGQPLLVVNVVNEIWRDAVGTKAAVASALDELATKDGLQVAFFCQEMREGDFYDLAAARETMRLMSAPAVVVPNLYYSPDELLGLLTHATVTLGGRYHFVAASVLAGTVPVVLARSAKMQGLIEDLGLVAAGQIGSTSTASITDAVRGAIRDRGNACRRLAVARDELAARARRNLSLWSRSEREGDTGSAIGARAGTR